MKKGRMKLLIVVAIGTTIATLNSGFKTSNKNPLDHRHVEVCGYKGCTFKTLFGEESSEGFEIHKNSENVAVSLSTGLKFLVEAQHNNGGWGAGSHSMQHIRDPHAVKADPATTSMVGMALIRNGNTLKKGEYSNQLNRALEYLLKAVEETPENRLKITDQSGTQIQTKLGDNIDAVLAAQFFNNILGMEDLETATKERVKASLTECVRRIESNQASDGSTQGDGWAGVLQSSFANQALEAAELNEIVVDTQKLKAAREFQKRNYDSESGRVNTDRGAGVMLYSVSGSVRASAKEAKRVKDLMDDAITQGAIENDTQVSEEVLEDLGLSKDEASRLVTSYNVYESAKDRAQEDEVISGFGNDGGEEFMSFLQTGESIAIAGGDDWKEWYDKTAGRILSIQNKDGSWSGHHCITSPVFCTATCLL
ncbi:MAG: hypothetical protein AAF391_12855, partial [Bacteroidota bacterium]